MGISKLGVVARDAPTVPSKQLIFNPSRSVSEGPTPKCTPARVAPSLALKGRSQITWHRAGRTPDRTGAGGHAGQGVAAQRTELGPNSACDGDRASVSSAFGQQQTSRTKETPARSRGLDTRAHPRAESARQTCATCLLAAPCPSRGTRASTSATGAPS